MNSEPIDLCVVIPVFNEEGAIESVLAKWTETLGSLGIKWQIHAYNDGSRDHSLEILNRMAAASCGKIVSHDKPNGGHGPTILQGYKEVSPFCEWVFQMDSDDEMGPESFPVLWSQRESYDFLVGRRAGRKQALSRKIVSLVSRMSVRCFYGKSAVWDVNSPYRLMRAETFRPFYQMIPVDTFAPNVILTGLSARKKLRCLEVPVPQRDRRTGEVSIKHWKLLKAAFHAFAQTISFALSAHDA